MGMPIRKNKSTAYSTVGPVLVITAPSGPYRPLFRTVSIALSGPYRPLFHTMSTAPSGPYSFLYPLLRFMQT